MSRKFQKIAISHLWAKLISLLNLFSPAMLWKTDIKKKTTKKATLNDHIWKNKTNLESRQRFSESSFNLLQNNIIFCTLYLRGYTAGRFAPNNPRLHCQRFAELKRLIYLISSITQQTEVYLLITINWLVTTLTPRFPLLEMFTLAWMHGSGIENN